MMAPVVRQFITDDEINESLSGGSGFSGGKTRIYEYWQEAHSAKEKRIFENEYGTGGHSHALPALLAVVKITMLKVFDTPKMAAIKYSFLGHRWQITY